MNFRKALSEQILESKIETILEHAALHVRGYIDIIEFVTTAAKICIWYDGIVEPDFEDFDSFEARMQEFDAFEEYLECYSYFLTSGETAETLEAV